MSDERRLRVVPPTEASATPPDHQSASHQPAPPHHPNAAPDVSALMESVAKGSTAAYEQLYDAVAGSVYGVALRIVRDPHMAEDVAQETLVEVWSKASQFRAHAGSARSWIMTIAQRRAVDRVRSEQSHTNRLHNHGAAQTVEASDGDDEVVDTMYAQWEAARVKQGLASLSDVQREALELTYYKGFTHREVAEALQVPLGTAKTRVRDGLMKLSAAIGAGS